MEAVKVAEGLYWVGAIDWDVRYFHGRSYTTDLGTTYNAYLIVDDKLTLVDTVEGPFFDEMLARIKSVADPSRIEYMIANHAELDHAGALPRIMDVVPQATFVCSELGKPAFQATFHRDWNFHTIKEGEKLSLGKRTLQFFPTPMLHWPDSMVTYLAEQKILLPNDAFGQHLASSERFDDEVPMDVIMGQATKYYANILLPLSNIVQRALTKLSGLKIELIGPSHGIIWRSQPGHIVDAYARWARGETRPKAVVIYDTMWDSTRKMAHAIVEGIGLEGVDAKLHNLSSTHRSDVMTDVLDARALVFGSPTLNNTMFPTLGDFLYYLGGLKPRAQVAAAFGSFGWGGGAVKAMRKEIEAMGLPLLDQGLEMRYVPDEEALARCVAYGRQIASRVK